MGGRQIRSQPNDRIGRVVHIPQHIRRKYAKDSDSALVKPSITLHIPLRPMAHVVAGTVDFDREAGLGTIKVQYIPACRILPPKDGAIRRTFTQSNP